MVLGSSIKRGRLLGLVGSAVLVEYDRAQRGRHSQKSPPPSSSVPTHHLYQEGDESLVHVSTCGQVGSKGGS